MLLSVSCVICRILSYFYFFFFFQAEDGIRDIGVTGVQTCALPIWFHVHDELSAPEGSLPVLRGALAGGGQLPNFLGVLAESPAALRGYARFRSELRQGSLSRATHERIALAVSERYHSEPGIALHSRTARQAGLGIDEVALAREFDSHDEREAALLRYLRPLIEGGRPPAHLLEEARESGWRDEQVLEAIA